VWHVVSDDGHPEQGVFTFSVGAGGVSTADIGALLASRSASRGIGITFGLDRALGYLACLVLVGGLGFLSWCWPEALARGDVRVLLLASATLALAMTVASVPLQAAYSSGGGASHLLDRATLRDVLSARFGHAAIARAGLIIALAMLVMATRALARSAQVRAIASAVALAGLGLCATFAYAGHGSTGRWPVLGFVLDVAHLGAAAFWLGGVAVLVTALGDRARWAVTTDGPARFSRLALPAVAVIVLSGLGQGWRQIGSWSALWHTSYARLLVLKVLVVLAVVVVASAARDALRDRSAPTLQRAVAGEGPASALVDDAALTELRNGIWIEGGLALVVLALTSALVVTAPGREAEVAAKRPVPHTFSFRASGQRVGYDVIVQPALAGENTIVVTPRLLGATGFLPAVLTGDVHAVGTSSGIPVPFTPLADGRWIATADLARPGDWVLDLAGTTDPTTDSAALQVTIR
jgi:copper transport protein